MIRTTAGACAAAAVTVMAFAAACGSSKVAAPVATSPASSSPRTSTAPTPSAAATPSAAPTPTAAAATAATLAQLKTIVVQRVDLPAGWTGAPYQSDPSDAAFDAEFDSCLGVRNTDPDKSAEADSDDFSEGDATISSSATSYRSAADVASDTAALRSPKLNGCFQTELRKDVASSLPGGATIEGITLKVVPRRRQRPDQRGRHADCHRDRLGLRSDTPLIHHERVRHRAADRGRA